MGPQLKGRYLTWLLVKNRFLAQTGLNVWRYEKDPQKKRQKNLMFIGLGCLVVVLVSYLGSLAVGYALLGLNQLTPGIALVLASVLTLFFTMLKANGELFGFKDYDLIMSLPFSTGQIINSRFLNMYVWNTLISLLVMVPMGAVYSWFAKPSWLFYPMWLVGIFLASLIPTTIAAIFGAGITAISAKFKYANVAATLLSFVLVIGILIGSLSLGTSQSTFGLLDSSGNVDVSTLRSLAPLVSTSINQFYPPAVLFIEGIVQGDFVSYLLFAGLSIGWYWLFVYVLSLRYQQINTAMTSHSSRADYHLGSLDQGGVVRALYKKTLLRILKSTAVATNLLMGCVMGLIAAAGLLVMGPEKLITSMDVPGLLPIIKSVAPFLIAAMTSMTNTACISLSLEGNNLWLIKSLPIPPKRLYDSYLLVNLTFTVPTTLICSLLMSIALKTTFLETINMFVTPFVFVIGAAVMGIVIGNRMAYYDWQGETQLVKQSMVSMLGMLGGVVVIGICGVLVNVRLAPIDPLILSLFVSFVILMVTVVIYLKESSRPIKVS